MVFGWSESSAAEPAPPPPTPWWEKEAASGSLDPDVDLGATLLNTAVDLLFDDELFDRLVIYAHHNCKKAAAKGAFGTSFTFLRFDDDTPWYRANNTGSVYRKKLADVLEPTGIAVTCNVESRKEEEEESSALFHSPVFPQVRDPGTLRFSLRFEGEYAVPPPKKLA